MSVCHSQLWYILRENSSHVTTGEWFFFLLDKVTSNHSYFNAKTFFFFCLTYNKKTNWKVPENTHQVKVRVDLLVSWINNCTIFFIYFFIRNVAAMCKRTSECIFVVWWPLKERYAAMSSLLFQCVGLLCSHRLPGQTAQFRVTEVFICMVVFQ